MAKYFLKNWQTFPFKRKSFEDQLDRYAKVCVASIDNPNVILDIIPIYGYRSYNTGLGKVIKLIRPVRLKTPISLPSDSL